MLVRYITKMLAKEESLFPTIYANLRTALVPLMDDDAYKAMAKTSAEVIAVNAASVYGRPTTCERSCTGFMDTLAVGPASLFIWKRP